MQEVKYLIHYTKKAYKQLEKLPSNAQIRIIDAIESKLLRNPDEFSKILKYQDKEIRSMRVGEYRVVFSFDSEYEILINDIFHRRRGY